jgi:hypothetical protein
MALSIIKGQFTLVKQIEKTGAAVLHPIDFFYWKNAKKNPLTLGGVCSYTLLVNHMQVAHSFHIPPSEL